MKANNYSGLILGKSPKYQLDWPIVGWMVLVHLLAVLALFHFTWSGFFIFLLFDFLTGCLGITFCFHRLLSHRSFKVHKAVEGFTALCGTLALQGSVTEWVAHHRVHHRLSDKEGDPHNARRGFFYSHMGWLLIKRPDLKDVATNKRLTKDIQNSKFLSFLSKGYVVVGSQVLLALSLLALGGLSWMLWGVFFRLMFAYHSTWFVNSATHKWGYRNFSSNDLSRNIWWVAVLTWGEGWHNNHHRFGNVCRAGYRWWEIDVTYIIIWSLQKLGLARDLHLYSEQAHAEYNQRKERKLAEASLEPFEA